MENGPLRAAYQRLVHEARNLAAPDRPADKGDPAEWILAHIIRFDERLTAAALRISARLPAVVDNTDAMCMNTLAVTIADRDLSRLIDLVEITAARLIDAVASVPTAYSGSLVQVHLVDRTERRVFDDVLPFTDVIAVRTFDQVPRHTRRLEDLKQNPFLYRNAAHEFCGAIDQTRPPEPWTAICD